MPCRFPRAIDIKDDPGASCAIRQPSRLFVLREWATPEIIEKERAQGVNRRLGERGQKARERRTRGQLIPPKERHERDRKGLEPLVKRFEGALGAYGIPEKNRQKIDDLVLSEAAAGKAHL